MRCLFTIPHVGHEASGPSYSVPRLALALAAAGHHVDLLTLDDGANRSTPGVAHLRFPESRFPPKLGWSSKLFSAVLQRAGATDIIHNHSLWMMPNVMPAVAAWRRQIPLIVSPRGTLSPVALARSAKIKKVFWALAQGPAVKHATCLHATSDEEYRNMRSLGLRAPIAIVPNGVDLPPADRTTQPSNSSLDGPREALYLGRIHPIKGIDRLIRAWAAIERSEPQWHLTIAGPDDGNYLTELRALSSQLGAQRVHFAGAAYGADKSRAYDKAELYILPTQSENFGMTIAEALAHGTPVITTHGAPWRGIERERCGWWIDHGVDPLLATLRLALAKAPDELATMGGRGRTWMEREYSWEAVAAEMAAVYRWAIHGGPIPPCIRLD